MRSAPRPPCSLAALGVVNALGAGAERVWSGLLAGEPSRLVEREDLVPGRRLRVGAVQTPLPAIPARLAAYACRNNAMALAALEQIEEPVREAIRACGPARVGVVMGTSTSGVSDAEDAIRHHDRHGGLTPSFDYAQLEFGGLASFVAAYLGVTGPAYTLSTACSSGARALASARSLLALGVCDAVVAGAADTLCGLTTNGFSALQAVCDGVTNPCSRNRAGLTLGEGAALFLVLPSAEGVQLLGVGESSEAHHMSAPEPGGSGAEAAMRGALADAGLAPGDIAYLNLHGTGTPLNDRMECLAVERVFGTDLPLSSTKPLVGHTLGAAGVMEAAFCWLALDRCDGGVLSLPPHRWDGERDPELPPVRLVGKGETLPLAGPARLMTNSFGFGGNNCTLVLGRAPASAPARSAGAATPGALGTDARGAQRAGDERSSCRARVLRWSAWAPGLETREAWEAWSRAPQPLAAEGHPQARFLPAMLRRRCSPLTRIVLTAAFGCLDDALRGEVRTVFASRHGSVNESIVLLEHIVRGERLSPATFSHTVHNAQAGLFCIAAGNRRASSSLAARAETFACGFLEALAHLEREPTRPVLYVMGDGRLAPTFAHLVDEPPGSYGVALLLGAPDAQPGADAPEIGFALDAASPPAPEAPWPDAAEFLRWLGSGEGSLRLGRFRWTRA